MLSNILGFVIKCYVFKQSILSFGHQAHKYANIGFEI